MNGYTKPPIPPSPPTGHPGRYLVYTWSDDHFLTAAFSNLPSKARLDWNDYLDTGADLVLLVKLEIGKVHFLKGRIDGRAASAEEIQKYAIREGIINLQFFHFEGHPPLSSYRKDIQERLDLQTQAEEPLT